MNVIQWRYYDLSAALDQITDLLDLCRTQLIANKKFKHDCSVHIFEEQPTAFLFKAFVAELKPKYLKHAFCIMMSFKILIKIQKYKLA